LPDELLPATKLTEAELYAEPALAPGQAAILAGLPQLDFQRLPCRPADPASPRP
jgi:hypothetical protein